MEQNTGFFANMKQSGKSMKRFILPIILLLVFGCLVASLPNIVLMIPAISSESSTNRVNERVIQRTNMQNLRQDKMYVGSNNMTAVVGIKYSVDGQHIYSVYEREGILRTWSISNTQQPEVLYSVGPIGLGAVAFNHSGEVMVSGTGVEWEKSIKEPFFEGIRVWDVLTGKILRRFPATLQSSINAPEEIVSTAVAISPLGDWIVESSGTVSSVRQNYRTLSASTIDNPKYGGCGYAYFQERALSTDDYDVIAFDPKGEFVAGMNQWSQLVLFQFKPSNGGCLTNIYAYVERAHKQASYRPAALAFDSQRNLLVAVQGKNLKIWNLQSLFFQEKFDVDLGSFSSVYANLAFSPQSGLMAIASKNGCQIWDRADRNRVVTLSDESAYSVDFSPNGEYLACGFENGSIKTYFVKQ